MKYLREEEFDKQFTPIKNHIDNNAGFNGYLYETHGKELEHVFELSKTTKQVWTIIESDDENMLCYASGFHRINRLGFLITEEPYTEEIEVRMNLD